MSKEINLEGYRLAHTMIRVKDLEASFNFYCKTLGMKVLEKQIIQRKIYKCIYWLWT